MIHIEVPAFDYRLYEKASTMSRSTNTFWWIRLAKRTLLKRDETATQCKRWRVKMFCHCAAVQSFWKLRKCFMKFIQSNLNLKKISVNPAFYSTLVSSFRLTLASLVTGYNLRLSQVLVAESSIRIGILYWEFSSEISLSRMPRRLGRVRLSYWSLAILKSCFFASFVKYCNASIVCYKLTKSCIDDVDLFGNVYLLIYIGLSKSSYPYRATYIELSV